MKKRAHKKHFTQQGVALIAVMLAVVIAYSLLFLPDAMRTRVPASTTKVSIHPAAPQ